MLCEREALRDAELSCETPTRRTGPRCCLAVGLCSAGKLRKVEGPLEAAALGFLL